MRKPADLVYWINWPPLKSNFVLNYDLAEVIAHQDAVSVPVPPADAPVEPPAGSPGGRPSKCTPELIQTITQCLRTGLTYPQTPGAGCVSMVALRNWLPYFNSNRAI